MGLMKIGEVAREISLSDRRIREYERAGLIRVRREPRTGDRLFDDRAIAQLRLIKTLIHDRGFTIEALRSLIQYAPCWELTDCPRRDSCPIISSPQTPCYELRASGVATECEVHCELCAIYLAKKQPRSRIVIPPAQATDSP